MNHRVVVTGMGVIAPNGNNLLEFEKSLRDGISGIRFVKIMQELNYACQVAGIPQGIDELKAQYFSQEDLLAMNDNMIYAAIAGIDCWNNAGLSPIHEN